MLGLVDAPSAGQVLVEMPVDIDIKFKDEHAEFDMKLLAKVVRNDRENRRLAVKFESLSPAIYDFFERSFSKRFHRHERKPA